MTMALSLTGGQVLSAGGGFETIELHIADGRIVDTPPADRQCIDCRGFYVLPGIVDVHGDAFELELHPRPGVDIPFSVAMASVDRQLLSNGITTAFHGLTISWEPGARSLEAGRRFMDGLNTWRARWSADHRVQLRWETFAEEAVEDIANWFARDPRPTLAFNDHTTSTLQAMNTGNTRKLEKWAARAGLSLDDYLARAETVAEGAARVSGNIRGLAEAAKKQGVTMLSHDERKRGERLAFRKLGADVCEFPLAVEVAAEAVAGGEHVVMGAPNVLRGGSHMGALGAEETIRDGLCTVLASDYYYPSLLHAVEHLVNHGTLPFHEAWRLISANPANAMGLNDRGTIEPGRRADLVVLDGTGPWRVVHTICGSSITSFTR